MSFRYGRCYNLITCSVAEARTVLRFGDDDEGFYCPECARLLLPVADGGHGRSRGLVWTVSAILVAGAALGWGGYIAAHRGRSQAPSLRAPKAIALARSPPAPRPAAVPQKPVVPEPPPQAPVFAMIATPPRPAARAPHATRPATPRGDAAKIDAEKPGGAVPAQPAARPDDRAVRAEPARESRPAQKPQAAPVLQPAPRAEPPLAVPKLPVAPLVIPPAAAPPGMAPQTGAMPQAAAPAPAPASKPLAPPAGPPAPAAPPGPRVVMLPAGSKLSFGPLQGVTLPSLPSRMMFVNPELTRKPGNIQVDCRIGLDGVPADCRKIAQKGGADVSDSILAWLGSGAIRYSPAVKDGHAVVERRVLTVNFGGKPQQ